MTARKAPTHTAYTLKRETRAVFRWLEIGVAHIDSDNQGDHHIYLDRFPIGAFTGHIHLSPIGTTPGDPEPQSERPTDDGGT
jgi:hypothetical protein